jgi:hypothetical protein
MHAEIERAYARNGARLDGLLRIAEGQGPVFDVLREGIGVPEISMLIAKEVLKNTSIKPSAAKFAKALGMPEGTVYTRLQNTIVKEAQ